MVSMPVRNEAPGFSRPGKRASVHGSNTIAAEPRTKSARLHEQDLVRHIVPPHPLGVKPAGNALISHAADDVALDLGSLSKLPHDLLLSMLSLLDPADLARLGQVNHMARAFAYHEPLWRDLLLDRFRGRMRTWRGSWRATVAAEYGAISPATAAFTPQTFQRSRPRQVFSDELYLQLQLASLPLAPYVPSEGNKQDPCSRVDRLDPQHTTKAEFLESYAVRNKPCLLQADSAEGEILPTWSLNDLDKLLGTRRIRAEALSMSMQTYNAYARCCSPTHATQAQWIPDESPFYLFDPTLARFLLKQNRFVVPRLLREDANGNKGVLTREWDLFSLLQDQRPDNMWVIAGPARSGSGWHVDPNHTSAYNTVLSGRKLWLLLPPHVTPPGVYISSDGSSITAPLSIAEWLRDFWKPCVRKHGRRGDNTLLVDVCGPGETIYVPAGWKHLVVNLDESVAFTQNFVSPAELPAVLDFLKNRSDQISGFRVKRSTNSKTTVVSDDESEPELDMLEDDGIAEKSKLFDLFAERLRDLDQGLYEQGMAGLARLESARGKISGKGSDGYCSTSWWDSLTGKEADAVEPADNISTGASTQQPNGRSLFASHLVDDGQLDDVPW